jgi:thiol-disulfide isomerase/thioredoxin
MKPPRYAPDGPRLSRRDWLKGAAGIAPLALGSALLAPPVRRALTATPIAAGPLDALGHAGPWLNGPSRGREDLRGKVVLIAVWTYSCINSLRVLPYLRAWQARYAHRGLVVIGLHAPEFGFEKDPANVRQALIDLDVDFPVVLDSDWRVWRALDNNAWPAFYFIGADGRLRGRAVGEGDYDRSERLIQVLLAEADGRPAAPALAVVAGTGPEAPPDLANLRTPETYLGYANAAGLVSPGGIRPDQRHVYRSGTPPLPGRWSLSGDWTVGTEYAAAEASGGEVACRFHARDLHMVLASAQAGRPVRFRVRIDGAAPGLDHGVDVDEAGFGVVREPRMYQLIRQQGPVADRTFAIEFLDPGARAYVFTFG